MKDHVCVFFFLKPVYFLKGFVLIYREEQKPLVTELKIKAKE